MGFSIPGYTPAHSGKIFYVVHLCEFSPVGFISHVFPYKKGEYVAVLPDFQLVASDSRDFVERAKLHNSAIDFPIRVAESGRVKPCGFD